MSLLAKLQEDMKHAMKAHETQRLGVIRMLISDVKNIDLAPKKLTEEQTVAAYAKRLRKSVEEYEKLGRAEEAATLKAELAIAESYLPAKASQGDTEKLVDQFLATHAFTEKEIGRAMGQFLKDHKDQVEPAQVNALLRQKLAGK
jgi:uncharacterized protein